MRRGSFALFLCLSVFALCGVIVASCHSAAGLAASCSINSDCDKPLICAFGHCHNACVESSDCPAGSLCVISGTNGVCELPSENACNATVPCPTPLLCASDSRCRTPCEMTNQCAKAQECVPQPSSAVGACFDTAALDGGVGDGGPDQGDGATEGGGGRDGSTGPDGAAGSDGASLDGRTGRDAMGSDGSGPVDASVDACPSALTQMGGIAVTAANPSFTSGLGVRSPTQLLIFSSYVGPAVAGIDGGVGDAGTVNLIYVEAFDPVTGHSLGPDVPAFSAPNIAGLRLEDAAVSPDGVIALLFGYGPFFEYGASSSISGPLYGAFLSANSADGGAPQIAVEQLVLLEAQNFYGQPHATWSPAASAFSLSWEEFTSATDFTLTVRNFTSMGTGAGGGTELAATTEPNGTVSSGNYDQGSVGATGTGLSAVTFEAQGSGIPFLTFLNSFGVGVGSPLGLLTVSSNWATVAGTQDGFVSFVTPNNATTSMVFVPVLSDGGLPSVDGGLAEAPVTLSSAAAVNGRAISDNAGGAGGVGAAVLTHAGVDFVYVNASGTMPQAPMPFLSNAYANGDMYAITNFAGSFGVSVYSSTMHMTQAAATGCP